MGAPEHITNKYVDTIKQESFSHAECHKDLIFQLCLGYQMYSYVQGNELRKCCQSTYQIRNHWLNVFDLKGISLIITTTWNIQKTSMCHIQWDYLFHAFILVLHQRQVIIKGTAHNYSLSFLLLPAPSSKRGKITLSHIEL